MKNRLMTTRRICLASGVATAAAAVTGAALVRQCAVAAEPAPGAGARPNRIAISTYSFWRFLENSRVPIDECILQSVAMWVAAGEVLHQQMGGDEHRDLQSLNRIGMVEVGDGCG